MTSETKWVTKAGRPAGSGMKRKSPMRPRKSGYLFVAPYVVLLGAIGIYPAGYVVYLALTSLTAHFTGLANFIDATHNSEFVPAFENIIKFSGSGSQCSSSSSSACR